jgi:uncharacterized RDD family membrane protein YckC
MTAPQGASGPRAGFGTRLVAAIIDGIVVGVVTIPLQLGLKGAGQALGIILGLAYYAYLEGSPSGQTVGKKAMNIRVLDLAAGAPIGFGRGVLRYIGRIPSALVLALGYLWMLWDPEKQTWHDKIANTVVVPTSAYPVEAWPG